MHRKIFEKDYTIKEYKDLEKQIPMFCSLHNQGVPSITNEEYDALLRLKEKIEVEHPSFSATDVVARKREKPHTQTLYGSMEMSRLTHSCEQCSESLIVLRPAGLLVRVNYGQKCSYSENNSKGYEYTMLSVYLVDAVDYKKSQRCVHEFYDSSYRNTILKFVPKKIRIPHDEKRKYELDSFGVYFVFYMSDDDFLSFCEENEFRNCTHISSVVSSILQNSDNKDALGLLRCAVYDFAFMECTAQGDSLMFSIDYLSPKEKHEFISCIKAANAVDVCRLKLVKGENTSKTIEHFKKVSESCADSVIVFTDEFSAEFSLASLQEYLPASVTRKKFYLDPPTGEVEMGFGIKPVSICGYFVNEVWAGNFRIRNFVIYRPDGEITSCKVGFDSEHGLLPLLVSIEIKTSQEQQSQTEMDSLRCPCCGEPLVIQDSHLYCKNFECKEQAIARLKRFASQRYMDMPFVRRFSEYLVKGGVFDPLDIYQHINSGTLNKIIVHPSTASCIERECLKARDLPIEILLSALAWKYRISQLEFRSVLSEYPNLFDSAKPLEQSSTVNFSDSFKEFLLFFEKAELSDKLKSLQFNLKAPFREPDNLLEGMVFKPDGLTNEVIKFIEGNGGTVFESGRTHIVGCDVTKTSVLEDYIHPADVLTLREFEKFV